MAKTTRAIPPRKIQYKDYADYLKSDKWNRVKGEYRQKEATNTCLCCSSDFMDGVNSNYHHFRYPKDWNNDTYENLIIVCEDCHKRLHDDIDHNSDPITIREYMVKMIYVYSQIQEDHNMEIMFYDMWVDCEGEFSIKQFGVSTKKHMKVEFITANKQLIKFFEDRRNEILSKGDDNV